MGGLPAIGGMLLKEIVGPQARLFLSFTSSHEGKPSSAVCSHRDMLPCHKPKTMEPINYGLKPPKL
jgi:hypothetical protein